MYEAACQTGILPHRAWGKPKRIMRKLSRLTAIRISKLCAGAGCTHIAPEHDTARAPAAGRAGRRSKREARARSQSKRLKWEAEAGALKARALYTVLRDDIWIGIISRMRSPACDIHRSSVHSKERGENRMNMQRNFLNDLAAVHTNDF